MKKLRFLALFLSLAMLLTGAVAFADDHKDVTLSGWYLAVDGTAEAYEIWTDAVHEAYPWISIELEGLTSDTIAEKFAVACATGTTPDLYIDGFSRCAPAVHAGLTVDLTEVIEANKDKFPGEQKDGCIDGRNYYVSYYDGAPYCFVANMSLIEELGIADMLPADKEVWSYDQFLDFCRAAKAAKSDVIPTVLYAGSRSGDAWYYSWFLGNGAKITNDDLTHVVINEEENRAAALEVLNLYKTMIDEELVPAGASTLLDADAESLFMGGNVIFYPTAYNKVPQMYNQMEAGQCVEFVCDAVALPTAKGEAAPETVSWGSSGIIGFANNGHEEEVKLAIDMLLKTPEARKAEIKARGTLSVMNDVVIDYATDDITAVMARAADYGARCANSGFGIRESWWSDFRETFYVQLQDFFVGNITAEQVLENWQTNADAVVVAAHN